MIALYVFLFCYALWVLYLAVMNLSRAKRDNRLPRTSLYLGMPLLYGGLVLDCILNATVGSILFLQIPREWTLTARLKKHIKAFTWRGVIARWLAAELLDPFDPRGKHV